MPVHTPVSQRAGAATTTPADACANAPADGCANAPGSAHGTTALAVVRAAAHAGEVVHVEHIPGQDGTTTNWPDSVRPEVAEALAATGIRRPWTHQAEAAALAGDGLNVIIATPAASGKSAGYLAAALSAILNGGTALYIAPTKALAADQLRVVRELGLHGIRPACHDGDSTAAERSWAQAHANFLLTNPDMLHSSMLPGHTRWRGFFRRLRVVVIDECHAYRGVFGSHVAQVVRRLRRIAAHHGDGEPGFILASATIADPGTCARLLTGLDAVPVTADGSPRSPLTIVLWEPPLLSPGGTTRSPARMRRPVTTEAASLLAELVAADVPSIAFVRSRRGAESVALAARERAAGDPERLAAYRSGYLADDRRDLEAGLRDGRISGLAATNALELGINVAGLDAVLIAGWPGTWASLWQQAGRAGRTGRAATAVFIARDDPLDSYLVRHPEALLGHPPEPAVLDPSNPYVLAPHLAAAAAELALTDPDLSHFYKTTPSSRPTLDALVAAGDLRQRESGWHWARRGHPARRISLRGTGGRRPIRIVEESTGRLVGTMDEPSAHHLVHDGAVYVHQGETYMVNRLDLANRVALVECHDPGYVTRARDTADIKVINVLRNISCGGVRVAFGDVQVSRQVLSFSKIRPDDAFNAFRGMAPRAAQTPLSLPPRELMTRAFWLEIPVAAADGGVPDGASDAVMPDAAAPGGAAPGGGRAYAAAHALEHAALSILPLYAACDQWDVAGASIMAPAGPISVYVHDVQDGGAGFAERGFQAARELLSTCAEAIGSCPCEAGCPSCVQSPRCGSGNSPLSKSGALALLHRLA
jgi:DEAD/DEAH box helicase domain-containing protein